MTLSSLPKPRPIQTADNLAALLDNVSRRDRGAFAELYQATSPKLFGVVIRIVKRKPLAEDILQDTYVKIWEKAAAFDASRGSAIGWMIAIARNRALDEVRRRPQVVSSQDVPTFDNIASSQPNADVELLRSEEREKLMNCLGKLEDDKRKMVVLAYQEGFSRETLAQYCDKPVATVKTWLRRALISLKECLSHE